MFLQHCTYVKTIALLIAVVPQLASSQSLGSETSSEKTPAAGEVASATVAERASSSASNDGARQNAFFKNLGKATDSLNLEKLRGGTEVIVSNDQKLKGTVADNSATNVATGSNNITSGAFANVSGIPIVIQNSGANVLIQNSTIINLQLH